MNGATTTTTTTTASTSFLRYVKHHDSTNNKGIQLVNGEHVHVPVDSVKGGAKMRPTSLNVNHLNYNVIDLKKFVR